MGVLLFIVILVVLIVVHELGHFFVAKWAGMRVEEFGIGYPPRALTIARKNGTEYTLNWLPFGGFVKIFGEDGATAEELQDTHNGVAFTKKNRFLQVLVLVAGITMNLVLAWVLLSFALALGVPRALSDAEAIRTTGAAIMVQEVMPDSAASAAGLEISDTIVRISRGTEVFESPAAGAFTKFVGETKPEEPVTLTVMRGGETLLISAIPTVSQGSDRARLGIGVASISSTPVSILQAPIAGFSFLTHVTGETAVSLWHFFGSIFTLSADLSQVSGPLGIAVVVGEVAHNGFATLLILTAVLSVNLALVNLIPVPALDGGRLLFVLIESVTRRPIPSWFSGAANGLGFLLLILLMIAITVSDVFKLVG